MTLPPFPTRLSILSDPDAVVTKSGAIREWRLVRKEWLQAFQRVAAAIGAAAGTAAAATFSGQGAALPVTVLALPAAGIAAGLYRISWYVRITRAAGVSSGVTVTVGWTDGGVGCASSGAALTGNTAASTQSGGIIVRADQASMFTVAATYASVGAPSMQFALDVIVEQVGSVNGQ